MPHKYKILMLLAVAALLANMSSPRALYHSFFTSSVATETQQQKIDNQFDPLTSAHIELEKLIKQYIPMPDSYQHISSRYERIQDQITVYTEYTAINLSGERSKTEAIVVYHANGLMINLLKVD